MGKGDDGLSKEESAPGCTKSSNELCKTLLTIPPVTPRISCIIFNPVSERFRLEEK